jgi:hypothetical protein
VLAFARRERIRPARGVALGALPSGKVRLVCPQCGAYRDLDGLTIVLLRAATASAILSTK